VAAFVLLAIGFCVLLFPMIYIPFFLASSALFASESLTVARLLDEIELLGWSAWSWMVEMTGLSPRSAKVIAATLAVVFTSCLCYAFAH
jgi:hypothetical protein